mgnify:CR=1 FL=1
MTPRLLADRYRLTETIGRGGMGTVWRAEDELLRRPVAVKEIRVDPGLDTRTRDELVARTLREARICAGLGGHPSIVTIHDVVLEEGRPWIVMELLEGRPLDRAVEEDGPLTPRRTAEIGQDLLSALETAHRGGVCHRDIKPGNIMLLFDGRAVLTDFGIASSDADSGKTLTGQLPGSPGYVAPERLRGGEATGAADVWSLGATLYYAVEGRPAYRGDIAARLTSALERAPDPPLRAGPLRPAIDGMMRRDPESRPPGKALADALESTARRDGETEIGTPQPDVPRAPHPDDGAETVPQGRSSSGEDDADGGGSGRSTGFWWWPPRRRHWRRWVTGAITLVLIPVLVNMATGIIPLPTLGKGPDEIRYGSLTDPPPGYVDNAFGGFSVMAPEHWGEERGSGTLQLTAPDERVSIVVRPLDATVGDSPVETMEEAEEEFLGGELVRGIEISEVNHPDGEAARSAYEGDDSSVQMMVSLVLLETDEGAALMMFGAPASDWESAEEQHRTALESFRAAG